MAKIELYRLEIGGEDITHGGNIRDSYQALVPQNYFVNEVTATEPTSKVQIPTPIFFVSCDVDILLKKGMGSDVSLSAPPANSETTFTEFIIPVKAGAVKEAILIEKGWYLTYILADAGGDPGTIEISIPKFKITQD